MEQGKQMEVSNMGRTVPLVASVLCVFGFIAPRHGQTAPVQASVAIRKADRILADTPVALDLLAAVVIDGAIRRAEQEIRDPAEFERFVEAMFEGPFTKQDYESAKKTIERIKNSVKGAGCFDRPLRLSVAIDRANRADDATIHVEGSYRARKYHRQFPTRRDSSDEVVSTFEKVSIFVDIPSDLADDVDLNKLVRAKHVIFTIQVLGFDISTFVFRDNPPAESDNRWIIESLSGKVLSVGRNALK